MKAARPLQLLLLLALLLLLLAQLASTARAESYRVVLESELSHDSDGLHELTEYAGYIRDLPSLGTGASAGVRAGYRELADPTGRTEFAALRVDHTRSLGAFKLSAYANPLISGHWSPLLGGASLVYGEGQRWRLEGSAETDIIDTQAAAIRHLRVNTYNLSSDYVLGGGFTVVGGVLHQDMTDGNARTGGLLKLIYAPPALEGFNLQVRARRLEGRFDGVGYFSPRHLSEELAQAQYGAPLGSRWVLTGIAGGGLQKVDGQDSKRIYLAELRLRGWFDDHWGLEARGGCTNYGELNTSSAAGGYRYCFGHLNLISSW